MKNPRTVSKFTENIFSGTSMDHHPTSFFILENETLGTFWVGQAKMILDECGYSLLPAVTQDKLIHKLETKYPEYESPCLDLVSINKNGTLPFHGVERWLSKLEYKLKKEPIKFKELKQLLIAGWHDHDFTNNSTLNVLHSRNKTDLKALHRRLVDEWESKGLRCLNTQTGKSYSERYEKCKKDPNFMYQRARKEVLRQMEKTKKLPKQSTLEKYKITFEEILYIKEMPEVQLVMEEPRGIIYKISSPSGKVYVGQTIRSFQKRMQEHKRESSGCTLIKRAINKYGDEMKYEIIEEDVPQEHLDEREMFWISHFNSLAPNGYNCNTGGQFNVVTQEIKDKVRDGLNKSKIDRDGYLGGISKIGKFFYPRIRQNYNELRLSGGGFQTEEEAIEVLKEYTKDPENFTIIDNRRMRTVGSITKQGNDWRVSYKSIYLGSHKTEGKAQEVLEKYLKDPENIPSFKRNVGNVVKRGNKWELRYKHKYLGTYETENEAYDDVERYLKDPENFTKPEVQINYGSVYPSKKRWALAYRGKYITSYETREEAQEALERYREDPDNFMKPQKKVGYVRFNKGSWSLLYRHKHIGNYATREEAEEARQTLQSS